MAETDKVTRHDIFLKARLMSEGVRMREMELPSFKELSKSCFEIDLPDKINPDDIDEFGMRHYIRIDTVTYSDG